jgi:hypothetical protein
MTTMTMGMHSMTTMTTLTMMTKTTTKTTTTTVWWRWLVVAGSGGGGQQRQLQWGLSVHIFYQNLILGVVGCWQGAGEAGRKPKVSTQKSSQT